MRQALLLSLVFGALVAGGFLTGCASVSVELCGIRAGLMETRQMPERGRVLVDWIYNQRTPVFTFGETYSFPPAAGSDTGHAIIRMAGEPPSWNDVCAMARLGHEVMHAQGKGHQ